VHNAVPVPSTFLPPPDDQLCQLCSNSAKPWGWVRLAADGLPLYARVWHPFLLAAKYEQIRPPPRSRCSSSPPSRQEGSFWVSRSRPEGGDLAGLAEHLIDVAGM